MNESDIVAVTKSIHSEDLIDAYKVGIFPWPISEEEDLIPWCSPDPRGVLDFNELHISRSTQRDFKKHAFEVKFCNDFESVIDLCAEVPRKDQDGTWISEDIKKAYIELFNDRKAYCVEVFENSVLVGGLYGVISESYISGESMFHLETGASKFALISLVKKLEKLGLYWIDTQMITPLVSSFGGKEITKKDFLNRLDKSKIIEHDLFERLKNNG